MLHLTRALAKGGDPGTIRHMVKVLRDLAVPEADIEEAVHPHPVPITDPKHPQVIRERLPKSAAWLRDAEERFAAAVRDAEEAGITADEIAELTGRP